MSDGDRAITLTFDGRLVSGRSKDTVGSCLLRAGISTLRRSRSGQERGLYCAIGVCNDCLVTIDRVPNVRACVTSVADGMTVSSQVSPPNVSVRTKAEPQDGQASSLTSPATSPRPVTHG